VQLLFDAKFQLLAGPQRVASHTAALDMAPHQFIGIEIGRIARQDVHRQLAMSRCDVFAHVQLLVRGRSVDHQLHRLAATLHHLLEQLDEQLGVQRSFAVRKPEAPLALTAEAAEIDWRCPGRWMMGVLPLGAQVLPRTVSARNPDSSQKYTSASLCRAATAMPG
jgi:hypothetical protein